MTETERVLTRREAADMLGRTPQTLARWSKKGIGPRHVRTYGSQATYRLSDLLAWVAAHEVGGDQEEGKNGDSGSGDLGV